MRRAVEVRVGASTHRYEQGDESQGRAAAIAGVDASRLILLARPGRIDLGRHVVQWAVFPSAVGPEVLVRGQDDLTVRSDARAEW